MMHFTPVMLIITLTTLLSGSSSKIVLFDADKRKNTLTCQLRQQINKKMKYRTLFAQIAKLRPKIQPQNLPHHHATVPITAQKIMTNLKHVNNNNNLAQKKLQPSLSVSCPSSTRSFSSLHRSNMHKSPKVYSYRSIR